MMEDAGPERPSEARNMREAFDLLRGYPMIEDFLAYQYVTDLKRSSLSFGECALLLLHDVGNAFHVSEKVRSQAILPENIQDLQQRFTIENLPGAGFVDPSRVEVGVLVSARSALRHLPPSYQSGATTAEGGRLFGRLVDERKRCERAGHGRSQGFTLARWTDLEFMCLSKDFHPPEAWYKSIDEQPNVDE
jgi:hypothetical protein